jgi:type II secretory pathway predicted ATPase ExeA
MLALKPLLQQHGISQAQLARDIDLSPALVAQLLNHEKWPASIDKNALMGTITEALAAREIAADAAMFEAVAGSEPAILVTPNQEGIDMLLRKQTLTPAARKHFSLFRDPFSEDVNEAEDVFTSPDIRYVREYLWSTARHGGFVAVIGESGSGKTTLRRDLNDRIAREDAPVIVIEPYVLGMEDNDVRGKTLKASAIADSIILTLAPNEKPRVTMEAKSRQLHRILKDSKRAGFNHCLIIEEAHGLSIATLKHLKRFFELEDGFKKLLSIVLIGQTELKIKLSERSPEVREVVQRCEVVELPPLDAQLDQYLAFKFQRVGKPLEEVFDKGALDGIRSRLIFTKAGKTRESTSLMYPLMINNLVTASLNMAATLGLGKVNHELIMES